MTARAKRQPVQPGNSAPYLSPLGAWSFTLGASIGWGSLVITSNTYLLQAGPLGSALGMLVGMAIMLVIAHNYHYLMQGHSSPGGVYTYARDVFGYDHGVLTAWFLALTYIAMFWANATSLPLFMRSFVGTMFQFGFSYRIFGYEVYLGEALLSIVAILLAGAFCMTRRRGVQNVMIALVLIFVVAILACFGAAWLGHGASGFSLEPLFVPDQSHFAQVLRIACISPWAFIGFEGISHLSDEFAFPRTKTFKVWGVALVFITTLYIAITTLSSMAYPAGFDTWLSYINDLDNQVGLARFPAFFVTQRYMGAAGVWLLLAALLALIVTSLIANIVALSRLLYALAQDEVIPYRLSELNATGVPWRAIRVVVVASILIPFLGRTAIGWIVDVTTLGATIVYGFVSACVIREARDRHERWAYWLGILGVVPMVLFDIMLLLPNLAATASMATESYILFTVWGIAGFIFFRNLLRTDDKRRFGKSIVAWLVLLSLILFTSLAWFGQIAESATSSAMESMQAYFNGTASAADLALTQDEFIENAIGQLGARVTRGIILVGALFMFSLAVMLSNFSIMRKREEESQRELAGARYMANRDQLTGVKNKRAYSAKEEEINEQIEMGSIEDFAVVVCDVNGLKQVNDTLGHKAGDEYIRSACMMVCKLFKHSPVYRIGGDEFVVVMQGSDFERRHEIMAELDQQTIAHINAGEVVVAAGMSEYDRATDHQMHAVFERADTLMYERKSELKVLQGLPER